MIINMVARPSRLSIAQVKEVILLLSQFYPRCVFKEHFLETRGDKDKKKSLKELAKNDFFTDEIDRFILNKKNYVGVHSAKDLPEILLNGLKVVAYTKGVDQRDAVVINEGRSFFELKKKSVIATSSIRREEMVSALRDDLKFIDIRGTIDERLNVLKLGKVDGVVIAEAAIQRLNLTFLNRYIIPEKTVSGQGQLAVVANISDVLMGDVFNKINHWLIA